MEHKLEHSGNEGRFFFGLCPISHQFGNDVVKACAGCHSIGYANRQAQKADWKRHKSICKALQPLGNLLSSSSSPSLILVVRSDDQFCSLK